MSNEKQKTEAKELFDALCDEGILPSSLRVPLNRVMEGDEYPGTADGVITLAKEALEKEESK